MRQFFFTAIWNNPMNVRQLTRIADTMADNKKYLYIVKLHRVCEMKMLTIERFQGTFQHGARLRHIGTFYRVTAVASRVIGVGFECIETFEYP